LAALEEAIGAKIYREGWNGKGQFVIKAGGYTVSEPRPGSDYAKAGITGEFTIAPHLDLKNAQGIMQPGWLRRRAICSLMIGWLSQCRHYRSHL
jgi:hypothetical protein